MDSPRLLLKFVQQVLERPDLLPSSGLYQRSSSCCGMSNLLLKCYVIGYLIVIFRKVPYFHLPPTFLYSKTYPRNKRKYFSSFSMYVRI